MDFLLNEKSLYGQFESVEAFLDTLPEMLQCIELVKKQNDIHVLKISDFYQCRITEHETLRYLKCFHADDRLRMLKLKLDKQIYNKPFWDYEPSHDCCGAYVWNSQDVSATAIAEAAERGDVLLSFRSDLFCDTELYVQKGEALTFKVFSVCTPQYLVCKFSDILRLSRDEQLKIRYENTRLDCNYLECKYGSDILEKDEFGALLNTLDKFVKHDSWEDIDRDDGLEYKKYSLSSPKNSWFANRKYDDMDIMKFRFSGRLRCFGYRKGERYRLLRIERDHKISNKG